MFDGVLVLHSVTHNATACEAATIDIKLSAGVANSFELIHKPSLKLKLSSDTRSKPLILHQDQTIFSIISIIKYKAAYILSRCPLVMTNHSNATLLTTYPF